MMFFFVAGSETTSTALSWFIYLMSKHPQIQQKIKEELIKEGEHQALTLDRLNSLTYLDCVIKELFRFCPVVDVASRTLMKDDRLPVCRAQLQKGDAVIIPIHNLARDSRYWSIDPNLFYPERFLNEDKNHHPYAFIPFGSGHRQCAGQDLAQFELKLIAARLMQYVTFGDGGPEVNAGGYLQHLTIGPRYVGVTITFDWVS